MWLRIGAIGGLFYLQQKANISYCLLDPCQYFKILSPILEQEVPGKYHKAFFITEQIFSPSNLVLLQLGISRVKWTKSPTGR
jgi:hypothetical protein